MSCDSGCPRPLVGYTGPYHRLVKRRPLGTLAGVHVMLSLATHTILLLVFQLSALEYLRQQPWYTCPRLSWQSCHGYLSLSLSRYDPLRPSRESGNILSSENTVLFQISTFQYVALAIAMSTAAPYRRPLYTNSQSLSVCVCEGGRGRGRGVRGVNLPLLLLPLSIVWFLLALCLLLPVNVYLTMAPADWWPWLWGVLELRPHPSIVFSLTIVELALLNFFMSYLLEVRLHPPVHDHVILHSLSLSVIRAMCCPVAG